MPSFCCKHSIVDVTIEILTQSHVTDSLCYKGYCGISVVDLHECCNWSSMNSVNSDLESVPQTLKENLALAIDKYVPSKKVTPVKKSPLWIRGDQKLLIRKREATRSRYD